MAEPLRIALPTGALLPGACAILSAAGIATIDPGLLNRQLLVRDGNNVLVTVRPADVPVYVEMGGCDAGIVGKDVLWESRRECYELVDLHFGSCRLVLAAPSGSAMAAGEWPASLRVATKYPRSARTYFDGLGVAAELIKLHGSVELAPSMGLSDCVLDITASGATLRANDLVEIAEVNRSTARLIVNLASLKTRSQDVSRVAAGLRRAVAASTGAGSA